MQTTFTAAPGDEQRRPDASFLRIRQSWNTEGNSFRIFACRASRQIHFCTQHSGFCTPDSGSQAVSFLQCIAAQRLQLTHDAFLCSPGWYIGDATPWLKRMEERCLRFWIEPALRLFSQPSRCSSSKYCSRMQVRSNDICSFDSFAGGSRRPKNSRSHFRRKGKDRSACTAHPCGQRNRQRGKAPNICQTVPCTYRPDSIWIRKHLSTAVNTHHQVLQRTSIRSSRTANRWSSWAG